MTIGKVCTWVCAVILVAFSAISTFGQDDKAGRIASLEFQKIKPGMSTQYEAGRKQKVAWHKSQNDSQPLFVWATIAGDNTGTYIVGRLGQHWADLDHPSVSDQADLDEFNKVVGSTVESLTTRYYEYMPKYSNPGEMGATPEKYSEIITFRVRFGHEDDFLTGVARVNEAAKKTNWPAKYQWYALESGGDAGTFVLVEAHPNWADFEEKPDQKPIPAMLQDAFGHAQAESIMKNFDSSVISESSEIIEFRADLSYVPGK
jgi:hypothetical protein